MNPDIPLEDASDFCHEDSSDYREIYVFHLDSSIAMSQSPDRSTLGIS